MKEFNGQFYHDDRLFVFHICLGTVDMDGDSVTTTIYHEGAPQGAKWCLVTYRNCEGYPASSVLHFSTKGDAIAYKHSVEPSTPLISRAGQSAGMSYDAYTNWKVNQGLEDYDYRKCYQSGGSNRGEMFIQSRSQFLASESRIKEHLEHII